MDSWVGGGGRYSVETEGEERGIDNLRSRWLGSKFRGGNRCCDFGVGIRPPPLLAVPCGFAACLDGASPAA